MPRRTRRDEQAGAKGPGRRNRAGVEEIAGRIVGPPGLGKAGFTVKSSMTGEKRYRCPFCQGWIEPATSHVVVYPAGRPEERRHLHSPCWAKQAKTGGGW